MAIAALLAVLALLVGGRAVAPSGATPLDEDTLVVTRLAQQSHGDGKGQGSAVAVAGGVVAVSNGGSDPEGFSDDAAQVYIYAEDYPVPGAWGLATTLNRQSADGKGSHRWGQSIALSGTTLAVGDPDEDCSDVTGDTADNCKGQVVLFTMGDDPTDWTYWASISPDQANERNNLGSSVALDGDWLVIGAPGTHLGDVFEGPPSLWPSAPYVEIWDLSAGPGTAPTKAYKERSFGFHLGVIGATGSELGKVVAIDGDYAFFGAPHSDQSSQGKLCSAQYYSKGTDSSGNPNAPAWHTVHPCISGQAETPWPLAIAVSTAGGQVALSAPNEPTSPGGGDTTGVVFMYDLQPGAAPTCANPFASDPATCLALQSGGVDSGALLGTSLAFSNGGSYLFAGAPGAASGVGEVVVYDKALTSPPNEINSYGVRGSFQNSADYRAAGSQFAATAAVGSGASPGEQVAVFGAPQQSNPDPPKSTGFAYVFEGILPAQLGLSVTAAQEVIPAVEGQTGTFTAELSNSSGADASGVKLVANLTGPGIPGLQSIVPTGGFQPDGFWDCFADEPLCEATGDFPTGETTTFQITVDMLSPNLTLPGLYDMVITATWDNPSIGATVTAATGVLVGDAAGKATLSATSADDGVVPPGGAASFDLAVGNDGAVPLQSPYVTATGQINVPYQGDPLVVPLVLTTTEPGWSCATTACTGPATMAAGQTVPITATAVVPSLEPAPGLLSIDTYDLDVDVEVTWRNSPTGVAGIDTTTGTTVGNPWRIEPASSGEFYVEEEGFVSLVITNVGTTTIAGVQISADVYAPGDPVVVDPRVAGASTGQCTAVFPTPQRFDVPACPGAPGAVVAPGENLQMAIDIAMGPLAPGTTPEVNGSFDVSWLQPTAVGIPGIPVNAPVSVTADTTVAAELSSPPPAPGEEATIDVVATNVGPSPVPAPTVHLRASDGLQVLAAELADGTRVPVEPGPVDRNEPIADGWRCSVVDDGVACTTPAHLRAGGTHAMTLHLATAATARPGTEETVVLTFTGGHDEIDPSTSTVTVSVPVTDGPEAAGPSSAGAPPAGATPARAVASSGRLPRTGLAVGGVVILGALLALGGAALVRGSRESRHRDG
ncbi:MAG: hypothetical protein JJU45_04555 [Acidimicrobiia bacterium]|nr:hypothetical protein [Acidimicrobiia bacterium]